jgi:regulator of nucleoside diphosphate kinase
MAFRHLMSDRVVLITEPDFDRLWHLIESPRYRVSHAIQLASLRAELERGRVVASGKVPRNIVTMHSRLRVRDLGDDETETYTLAYPDEADISEGRLSVLAPMGIALLGARVGQVVEVDAPGGMRRLRVVTILYQPEAAGDDHR